MTTGTDNGGQPQRQVRLEDVQAGYGRRVEGLTHEVVGLELTVADRDAEIAQLRREVERLTERNGELEVEVAAVSDGRGSSSRSVDPGTFATPGASGAPTPDAAPSTVDGV